MKRHWLVALVIAICSSVAWAGQRPSPVGSSNQNDADEVCVGDRRVVKDTRHDHGWSRIEGRALRDENEQRPGLPGGGGIGLPSISSPHSFTAKAGALFTVREFRSQKLKQQGYEIVAYHQEGPDVVALTVSAQSQGALQRARSVFDALLKTYDSAKIKVKPER